MSGEITPSKIENYGYGEAETCPPGKYWNFYANKCQPIFQGKSSAWYINHQKPDADPEVSIPGTTLPGFGVGKRDPMDKPTNVVIDTDYGYIGTHSSG
jgi:hypothetical protein